MIAVLAGMRYYLIVVLILSLNIDLAQVASIPYVTVIDDGSGSGDSTTTNNF